MSTTDFSTILGPLAPLQADPEIFEIVVDAPDRVYIRQSGNGFLLKEAGVQFASPEAIRAVIDAAFALGGMILGPANSTGEVRLPDGSRMVAVIPPTALDCPHLVIRKPDHEVFTWDKLLKIGTLSAEAHTVLMQAIKYRLNIMVTGNDGSGKSYVANLLAESLPPEARVIVVGNAFEMPIRHPRRIHLEPGGPANLSLTHLLNTAVKLNPDWLVIGEMHGAEAMTALQLMRSGYRTLTTLYASGPEDALARLEAMCLLANPNLGLTEIRSMIAATIGLITYQQNYTLPDYRIKITRLVELQGIKENRYLLQPLFTYNNESGQLEPTSAHAGWAERTRQKITQG
jgi:pilus assembly protein CpaF